MAGVVGGKDLPAQPSEEEFRLGLRSGIMLCNVLNKVQSGAVPKVVEAPPDTVILPDGAALSAYQYFENIRNFLDAIEQMGIPAFEASDLEQGGKSSRIVNCLLALKSYNDWKQQGGDGVWKFSGNTKPPSVGKQFFMKNSDLFMNSISRNSSTGEKSIDSLSSDHNSTGDFAQELNETGTSHSLHILVRELLSDKAREDIPVVVEDMLSKVMEEFEHRLAVHNQQIGTNLKDNGFHGPIKPPSTHASEELEIGTNLEDNGFHGPIKPPSTHASEELETSNVMKDNSCIENHMNNREAKHKDLVEHQQRSIQELKNTLHSARQDMHMLQMKHQEEVNNLGEHLHGLAHAASGYQKVLEENRKLYNQVQDLKGNIRVYCRVRPFLPGKPIGVSTVGDLDERAISILTPSKSGKEAKKAFTFNKVFGPAASQEEVFVDTQPLIRSVLDGYNVCIFAYGQTGSGKTYTMNREKTPLPMSTLEIRNNTHNGVNVPNANLVPVTSTSDVIYLMNLGHKNRAVGATAMNNRSSRSHSCLTVHVQGKDLTSGSVLRGCMHLVDLAGSERVDKTEATGDRLKEAQHINRSLSALGDVISSLAQKNAHVPYRNSKLTQLLQDALGGQAKTLMFVHISPEPDALGETISTLKFAERVSTVELGAAKTNKDSSNVKELKEQIASLKAALARKEAGELSHLQNSTSSSPERPEVKSYGSSPSLSSCLSIGDIGKLEGQSNSSSTSRRHSLDAQDFAMTSPPWPVLSSPGLMEDEKSVSGDWVDKVMVNKQDALSDEDCRQLPEMFYHHKVYPEQAVKNISSNRRHSLDNGLARTTEYEAAVNDDSDELEAATSDSSELDYQLQVNVPPRPNIISNVVGSKLKRPSPKQKNSPEKRSLIPQPSTRRVPNGVQSPLQKNVRQQGSIDGRRKQASGK
ncbi:hypothetical protein RD792_015880 [Penstemon davidsonii]|uniref:Uncharacterized protein n=1 Tax=Penstemon davidsonii TaxID=160366 RepID=A0ABR0CII4_9LAMI|nr:hypothetical protein RD792_015880 [Penstemon davidsonii]